MSNAPCVLTRPHDPHSWGDLNWCQGVSSDADDSLLSDIAEAEAANMHARGCQVCDALEKMSESARAGVERALAGTIGERTLSEILTRNGYPTGRRAVSNHRKGHAPSDQ